MNSENAPSPQVAETHTGSSQDIEDFIYLISHDVRASVRALLELPHWIVEDLEEAGVKVEGSVAASIELMNRHTGRLDRMLVDLLTFSRVGRMQEVRSNILPLVIEQVLEEIQLPAGFKVIKNLECEAIVMGDRDILTLFDALIRNALKHHDKRSGQIVVSSAVQGGEAVLSVADDGPGIPLEYRENVFGAMRTLRPRDEVEGSGMGLTNVRKIAALYGGTAHVTDSPYGRGTLAEVRLPLTGLV
ncbi:HAMP domain-containing histidine kinase [Sulfitobacter sp. M57]|uniref:sensor histidine kinase n=1 Tax=unclassified Sulfitobacter TaxID=196795 RepID=UPI0023E28312|nr:MULTISPECIES: HAMP domain-containing sensor histidine kinase [unclassified Sulfitobacter]MDF3415617.1 HAMP domain-containing histidine kinase [Sulfitobacter sp. KE5]MDF3423097.1 HAMP domain-containing histidine kinase [Sulfitobacter sp. KE43]MDF3434163.1 HAMP domain-containing histidine kinase [Sulfitobacter sp. KE42]MDF3459804.1 HAMP domain-containing histidine kinase [Sulfitobacter sp. S74]MDF3463701.1 HAMP domain-containing histidine kinase [Sulfitobacter sp. Ks18]